VEVDGDPPGAGSVTIPSKLTTTMPASQASFTAPFSAVGEAAFSTMAS
jgi:hypothetical protein